MAEKNSNQRVMKAGNLYRAVVVFAVTAIISGLFLMACATQGVVSSGVKTGSPVDTIYEVSEQEALNLAQWAVEQTLPDQNVQPLKKPRMGFLVHETVQKGIAKYARFRDAVFIYEIDLLRMAGSTAQGQNIAGYTFSVNGDGDLKTGPETLARLEQQLQEAFEQTGRAVAVSSSRPQIQAPAVIPQSELPKPETSKVEKTPAGVPAEKPVLKAPPAVVVPMAPAKEQPAKDEDVFMKLKKLKELRDKEIITEDEFQSKKKELLDRI